MHTVVYIKQAERALQLGAELQREVLLHHRSKLDRYPHRVETEAEQGIRDELSNSPSDSAASTFDGGAVPT